MRKFWKQKPLNETLFVDIQFENFEKYLAFFYLPCLARWNDTVRHIFILNTWREMEYICANRFSRMFSHNSLHWSEREKARSLLCTRSNKLLRLKTLCNVEKKTHSFYKNNLGVFFRRKSHEAQWGRSMIQSIFGLVLRDPSSLFKFALHTLAYEGAPHSSLSI